MCFGLSKPSRAADQNGGYLRISVDQRWLQAVIRFQARHRAKRRLGATSADRLAGANALRTPGSVRRFDRKRSLMTGACDGPCAPDLDRQDPGSDQADGQPGEGA
jgi:hypothetical protein